MIFSENPSKPTALLSVKELNIAPEETAYIKCDTTGYPRPHIEWFINNIPVSELDEKIISLSKNVLSIKKPTKEFEGIVLCRAVSVNNETAENSATIKLIPSLAKKSVTETLKINHKDLVKAEVGETVKLVCSSTESSTEFVWTKEGQANFTHQYESNGVLLLTNVALSDSGLYKCGAVLRSGVRVKANSPEVIVNVSKPVVKSIQAKLSSKESLTMKGGDQLELSCIAELNYKNSDNIETFWYFNNNLLSGTDNSKRYTVTAETQSDAGVYSCQIADSAFNLTSPMVSTKIAITPELKVSSNKYINIKEISLLEKDSLVEITCSLKGFDKQDLDESANVIWQRVDDPSDSLLGNTLYANQTQATLQLHNITHGDAGDYSCSLSNYNGSLKFSEQITIKVERENIGSN
jgi:hypothetical protein